MEYNEFYEDESEKGGRRYKKDPTKRTLNLGVFNGAYLMDRIIKLFTSDELTSKPVRFAHFYKLHKDKGRIGLNISTMSQRKKLMEADITELLKKSYNILHDPRKNGNKMEFTYSIDNKLFSTKFTIIIDFEQKKFLLEKGEFYSECFPTPLTSDGDLLDDRNTFFEIENYNSYLDFSSTLKDILTQESGGARMGVYRNEQMQFEMSDLALRFLTKMFANQVIECDKVELQYNRKRKPFNKLEEGYARMLQLMNLIN
jgi:hypothetical protein